MSEIKFEDLNLKENNDITVLHWGDEENPIEIEIKQYLSIDKKFNVIAQILNESIDIYNFYNPVRIESFYNLYMIMAYTNIILPTVENENGLISLDNASELYDKIMGSKILDDIMPMIPQEERAFIYTGAIEMIKSVYSYNNSAAGVLSTLSENYKNLDKDATNITEKISDPNNLELLKDVITKLG